MIKKGKESKIDFKKYSFGALLDVMMITEQTKKSQDTYKLVDDENVEKCVICNMPFELNTEAIVLDCEGHHYVHAKCVEEWLFSKKQCPICREFSDKAKI